LNIEMALLPSLVREADQQVCIVVDVLRATSTISAFFERGISEVYIGSDLDEVAAIADSIPGCVKGGERGGMAPPGFQFSNSPTQILASQLDLTGLSAAFSTTNGTRAMVELYRAGAPVVFSGCVRNGPAVAAAALQAARERGCHVTVVASGREHGSKICLEDVIVGGYLVYLLRQEAKLDNRPASMIAQLIAQDDDPDYVALDHSPVKARHFVGDEVAAELEEEQHGAITRYPFIPFNAVPASPAKDAGQDKQSKAPFKWRKGSAAARMVEEGATLALRLYFSYVGEYNDNPARPSRRALLAAINECSGGHHLLRYGWAADSVAVSDAGVCEVAPYLTAEAGRLVLRPYQATPVETPQ